MRALASLAVAVAALGCGDVERNPVLPGGSGSKGAIDQDRFPDAGQGDDVVQISGTVCQLLDVRQPELCAANPPGLVVSIDGVSTLTGDDGEFRLALDPILAGLEVDLVVEDPGGVYAISAVPVVVPEQGSDAELVIPVLATDTLLAIEQSLGEVTTELTSIVFSYVRQGGEALAGAQIAEVPVGTLGGVYYGSGVSPFVDAGPSTNLFGMAAIFGVPAAGGEALYTVSAGDVLVDVAAPVVGGGISFVPVVVPEP